MSSSLSGVGFVVIVTDASWGSAGETEPEADIMGDEEPPKDGDDRDDAAEHSSLSSFLANKKLM